MIILIHGAWHGAWVWDRVKAPGMLTPELDLDQGANLSRHAAAIGELIARGETRVLLVGHSYGAAVAQLAAGRHPDRIRGLICLDGFLLRPGQAVADLLPPRIRADWLAQGSMVAPLGADVMAVNPADRDWVAARLRPHPLACFTEAAADLPAFTGPRCYVRAAAFAFPPFDRMRARCALQGWRCETIATGHDIMLAAPGYVGQLIEEYNG